MDCCELQSIFRPYHFLFALCDQPLLPLWPEKGCKHFMKQFFSTKAEIVHIFELWWAELRISIQTVLEKGTFFNHEKHWSTLLVRTCPTPRLPQTKLCITRVWKEAQPRKLIWSSLLITCLGLCFRNLSTMGLPLKTNGLHEFFPLCLTWMKDCGQLKLPMFPLSSTADPCFSNVSARLPCS